MDSQLRKLHLALELGIGAPPRRVPPLRLARVEHEPAFPLGDESVLSCFEWRLGNHRRKPAGPAPNAQRKFQFQRMMIVQLPMGSSGAAALMYSR
jgi:hypothetical protein